MSSLAVILDGRWHPGIGDPTPMGWTTVGAYFATAILYFWWGRSLRRRDPSRQGSGGPAFCNVVAALMLLLGVNKQLDLQSWLTQTGITLAHAQGWYEERRAVQVAFVAALVISGLAVFLALLWWTRGRWSRFGISIFGLAFLGCFVAIRAVSVHRLDRLIGMRLLGVKMNWAFELGAIGILALGAILHLRRLPAERSAAA